MDATGGSGILGMYSHWQCSALCADANCAASSCCGHVRSTVQVAAAASAQLRRLCGRLRLLNARTAAACQVPSRLSQCVTVVWTAASSLAIQEQEQNQEQSQGQEQDQEHKPGPSQGQEQGQERGQEQGPVQGQQQGHGNGQAAQEQGRGQEQGQRQEQEGKGQRYAFRSKRAGGTPLLEQLGWRQDAAGAAAEAEGAAGTEAMAAAPGTEQQQQQQQQQQPRAQRPRRLQGLYRVRGRALVYWGPQVPADRDGEVLTGQGAAAFSDMCLATQEQLRRAAERAAEREQEEREAERLAEERAAAKQAQEEALRQQEAADAAGLRPKRRRTGLLPLEQSPSPRGRSRPRSGSAHVPGGAAVATTAVAAAVAAQAGGGDGYAQPPAPAADTHQVTPHPASPQGTARLLRSTLRGPEAEAGQPPALAPASPQVPPPPPPPPPQHQHPPLQPAAASGPEPPAQVDVPHQAQAPRGAPLSPRRSSRLAPPQQLTRQAQPQPLAQRGQQVTQPQPQPQSLPAEATTALELRATSPGPGAASSCRSRPAPQPLSQEAGVHGRGGALRQPSVSPGPTSPVTRPQVRASTSPPPRDALQPGASPPAPRRSSRLLQGAGAMHTPHLAAGDPRAQPVADLPAQQEGAARQQQPRPAAAVDAPALAGSSRAVSVQPEDMPLLQPGAEQQQARGGVAGPPPPPPGGDVVIRGFPMGGIAAVANHECDPTADVYQTLVLMPRLAPDPPPHLHLQQAGGAAAAAQPAASCSGAAAGAVDISMSSAAAASGSAPVPMQAHVPVVFLRLHKEDQQGRSTAGEYGLVEITYKYGATTTVRAEALRCQCRRGCPGWVCEYVPEEGGAGEEAGAGAQGAAGAVQERPGGRAAAVPAVVVGAAVAPGGVGEPGGSGHGHGGAREQAAHKRL